MEPVAMAQSAQPHADTAGMTWPASDLEHVTNCPVCGSAQRARLYDDLRDWTFRCAPGCWAMWRCAECSSAYLDPRPDRASIARAYRNYYTHGAASAAAPYAALGPLRKWRRKLVNGYAAWRFGLSSHEPASRLGVFAALVFPPFRTHVDHRFRHLPRPGTSARALLDVGCGDGSFLALASACGWPALGIDADADAVARARARGLSILHGGLDVFDGRAEEFDVITLSHAIEHMHDPVAVLRTCHRLLKPGGQLWLETPNVDSYSHIRFGRFWRGLEAPRHLVLFCERSLHRLLGAIGFVAVRRLARPGAFHSLYCSSDAIRATVTGVSSRRSLLRIEALLSTLRALAFPKHREHLATVARKRDAQMYTE